MLFKVIVHLIQVFPAVKLGNPGCDTIQESETSQAKLLSQSLGTYLFLEGRNLLDNSERPNQKKLKKVGLEGANS